MQSYVKEYKNTAGNQFQEQWLRAKHRMLLGMFV